MLLHREFEYRWHWRLPAPPEAVWPLVSDTNRFNRDTGLPSVHDAGDRASTLANRRQRLRLIRFGIPLEWEEQPFEWVRPHRFSVLRRYARGPVAQMRVEAQLEPTDGNATRLTYRVSARPRTLLGLLAIPVQVGFLSARSFDRVLRRYGEIAAARAAPAAVAHDRAGRADLATTPRALPRGALDRIEGGRRRLSAEAADAALVDCLTETVLRADDLAVARMRPYAFAHHWGAPRRQTLELFLRATRAGLLDLQWELLCPLCRGAKSSAATLGALETKVHCESCNIDLTANFDRAVELTFRPNPAIRTVEVGDFCIGGPQVTPHVVVQQLLAPGERRTVRPALEQGRHRLRTLELPGARALRVAADGAPEITFRAEPAGWPADEFVIAADPLLHLENSTPREQLLILERTAWSDDAATAAEVMALQCFRDLFSSELLRAGESIAVGSLALLFTDLRESTRLYREIGDAPAFGRVMDHFQVLRAAITEEDGAIVKTIGDAVMAAFRQPVSALRAIVKAQRALAAPPRGERPLFLKAGIHYGPCIAVNLNEHLDYFGSAVNLAARLETLSSGEDIVLSSEARHDSEVSGFLAAGGLHAQPEPARLKGFEAEIQVWRIAPAAR
ncbi:MAG: hypothetical protein HY704_03270 [Gemmatimonadetes bacterium]|nr:hypothetical protein [Gemmatimonadota bacterium]